jgi:hypothetical protein
VPFDRSSIAVATFLMAATTIWYPGSSELGNLHMAEWSALMEAWSPNPGIREFSAGTT